MGRGAARGRPPLQVAYGWVRVVRPLPDRAATYSAGRPRCTTRRSRPDSGPGRQTMLLGVAIMGVAQPPVLLGVEIRGLDFGGHVVTPPGHRSS